MKRRTLKKREARWLRRYFIGRKKFAGTVGISALARCLERCQHEVLVCVNRHLANHMYGKRNRIRMILRWEDYYP